MIKGVCTDKEQLIIFAKFEYYSYREMEELFGLSYDNVRRIYSRGVKKIKVIAQTQLRLPSYVEEYNSPLECLIDANDELSPIEKDIVKAYLFSNKSKLGFARQYDISPEALDKILFRSYLKTRYFLRLRSGYYFREINTVFDDVSDKSKMMLSNCIFRMKSLQEIAEAMDLTKKSVKTVFLRAIVEIKKSTNAA